MTDINKDQKMKAIRQRYLEECSERSQQDHIPGYFDPYDKPFDYQIYYRNAVREMKQLGISDDEITKYLEPYPTIDNS